MNNVPAVSFCFEQQPLLTIDGQPRNGGMCRPGETRPAILDRVMGAVEIPAANPAPHRVVARHIAEFLSGEVRWLKKDQPLGPGQVR
jgi:hypothetical protein